MGYHAVTYRQNVREDDGNEMTLLRYFSSEKIHLGETPERVGNRGSATSLQHFPDKRGREITRWKKGIGLYYPHFRCSSDVSPPV